MKRLVFHIGFSHCGFEDIKSIFEANGYASSGWHGGAIAQNIIYAKASGNTPLESWVDKITVFSEMESINNLSQPPLEAFKEFEYLDKKFPNAIFILAKTNVEEWIVNRYLHQDGRHALHHSIHSGVPLSDLANVWEAEWEDHINKCQNYFKGKDTYVEMDTNNTTVDEHIQSLSCWFDLSARPPMKIQERIQDKNKQLRKLNKLLKFPISKPKPSPDDIDETANTIAKHCIPEKVNFSPIGYKSCSNVFAIFDATNGTVMKKDHTPHSVIRTQEGHYISESRADKLYRLTGIINEINRLGGRGEYIMDLQDGRKIGSPDGPQIGGPILSYCRRIHAENVFLWPLPEYHSIGNEFFVGGLLQDSLPFSEKKDIAVWRGAISGHCVSDEDNGHQANVPTHQVLSHISNLVARGSLKKAKESLNILRKSVRFSFVERMSSNKNFNVALTPPRGMQRTLVDLGIARLLDDFRPLTYFHKFRYVISLRGYDTGSNFISAANSMSVVLKEEDGWDLFYSCLFKPWEHYIPLEAGAVDVEEKLAWAREHYDHCLRMSENSRRACLLLENSEIRDIAMAQVLQRYDAFFTSHT